MIPLEHILALSVLLFVIGLAGAVLRRDLLAVLISLQIMLGASGLALIGFNRVWASASEGAAGVEGQAFALLVVGIGVANLSVGLGLMVALVRSRNSIDADDASVLRW